MNWKASLTLVACSLLIGNSLEAAKVAPKSFKNPQTLNESTQILNEINGQMQLMQEQLSSLKTSQQLLSAESAIKNLSPKVRKMEVHLERLEKQLEETAQASHITQIKNEMNDLKGKFNAVLSTPTTTVNDTISALNPTLERLQKQVYSLYDAIKNEKNKNAQLISEKMQEIELRLQEFRSELSSNETASYSAASSINVMRQALIQSHEQLVQFKNEIERFRTEEFLGLSQALADFKKSSKEELTSEISSCNKKLVSLSKIYQNSLTQIGELSQKVQSQENFAQLSSQAFKSLEQKEQGARNAIRKLYMAQNQFGENLKALEVALNTTNLSLESKYNQLVSLNPVEKFKKGFMLLKEKHQQTQKEIDAIHQNVSMHAQNFELFRQSCDERLATYLKTEDLNHFKNEMMHLQENAKKLMLDESAKQILALTESAKKADMVSQRVAVLETKNENLAQGVSRQLTDLFTKQAKLAKACVAKIKSLEAKQTEMNKLVASLQSSVEATDFIGKKLDSLVVFQQEVAKKFDEQNLVNQQSQVILSKLNELEASHVSTKESLYTSVNEVVNASKQQNEIHGKIQSQVSDLERNFGLAMTKMEENLNMKTDVLKDVNELIALNTAQEANRVQLMINELNAKLTEKEEMIQKLTRRVNFLTKTLSEKLEVINQLQSQQDIEQLKTSIEEKVEKQLKSLAHDRMMFDTLIQRIAALEASLHQDGGQVAELSD
jgi:hypothetical protein